MAGEGMAGKGRGDQGGEGNGFQFDLPTGLKNWEFEKSRFNKQKELITNLLLMIMKMVHAVMTSQENQEYRFLKK